MITGPCPECGHPVSSAARACPECGNTRFNLPHGDEFWEICRHCKGTGRVRQERMGRTVLQECSYCGGGGTALYQAFRDARTGEETRAIVHPKLRPRR